MIGKLLGNTQVQTTERYAYLANDPVKAAANRIASRIADIAGLSATLRSAGRCRSFFCLRARRAWRSLTLFDRFLDEPECIGVLDQGSYFRAIQTGWNFGVDLEFQGHLAAGKGRELLDNRLDDLMDIPRRAGPRKS